MEWEIKLNAYSLTYNLILPLCAIKGQVLANFITHHPSIPIIDVSVWANNYVGLQPSILSFDGSWTQDDVGVGLVLINPNGKVWWYSSLIDPNYSNNQAEYEALILGLKIWLGRGAKCVWIYGDYQLVIWHVNGEYKCNTIILDFYKLAKQLLQCFADVIVEHIYRDETDEANEQHASRY